MYNNLTIDKIFEVKRKLDNIIYSNTPLPIKIYFDSNITKKIQTKYPKKKNNNRWVKKYRKKYTQTVPSDKIYYSQNQGIIYCHPILKTEIDNLLKENKTIPLHYID